MDANQRLAHLRALTSSPATLGRSAAIRELFAEWPSAQSRQIGETYLEQAASAEVTTAARHPSPRTWDTICHAVDGLWGKLLNRVVVDLETTLSDWPQTLRLLPRRWWYDADDQVTKARLARHLVARHVVSARTNWPEFFRSPALETITALDLRRCGIALHGARALATAELTLTRLGLGDNGLADEELAVLLPWITGQALTHLDLSHNRLSPAGLSALFQDQRAGPRLQHLSLDNLRLHRQTVGVVSRWVQGRGGLESLSLRSNGLGVGETDLLATAVIGRLDVSNNPLGNDGLAGLLRAMTRTHELVARRTQIDQRGAFLLALARLPHLRSVDLSFNDLGDAWLAKLGSSGWYPKLRRLRLSHTGLMPTSAPFLRQVLAGHERDIALRHLDLSGNELGLEAVQSIVDSGVVPQLRSLDLSANPIGDRGLEVLLGASPSSLRELRVARCQLGPMSLDTLQQTLRQHLPQLVLLDVSNNPLSMFAAQDLAREATWDHVEVVTQEKTLSSQNQRVVAATRRRSRLQRLELEPARESRTKRFSLSPTKRRR